MDEVSSVHTMDVIVNSLALRVEHTFLPFLLQPRLSPLFLLEVMFEQMITLLIQKEEAALIGINPTSKALQYF